MFLINESIKKCIMNLEGSHGGGQFVINTTKTAETANIYESDTLKICRKKPNHYEKICVKPVVKSTDKKSDHIGNLGEETCFFVLASPPGTPVATTSGIPSYDNNLQSCFPNKYSTPYHSYDTIGPDVFTRVHIPKETSLSSGVASGESSDTSVDIPNTCKSAKSHRILVDDCDHDYSGSASPLAGTNVQVNVRTKDFESFDDFCNDFTKSNKQFRTQSTQTDHTISCPCPCSGARQRHDYGNPKTLRPNFSVKSQLILNSPLEMSSRRDSGYSSQSYTPVSPRHMDFSLSSISENDKTASEKFNAVDVIVNGNSKPLKQQYDEAKESYLASIKKTHVDFGKELFLIELKKLLLRTELSSLSPCGANDKTWQPISPKVKPLRSVLRNGGVNVLEIRDSNVLRARKNNSPVSGKEVVDIILQVRQCLHIVQKLKQGPEKNKIKIYQKVKLKSYQSTLNKDLSNNLQTRKRPSLDKFQDFRKEKNSLTEADTNCFPCNRKQKSKQTVPHNAPSLLNTSAKKGDIKKILELMQANQMDVNQKDSNGWPAIHHAFKNKHYRTAFLLLEAGANMKEYTNQRIKEYKTTVEILNKNKVLLKS
ncbi:uncharacterized protein LOC130646215 isoform X2 [Hydractinia symbiolongicarpus]|uniref:uncharacterized protein LOC130646215 isoform X2 n=1 Tax=Hydractinia symbiolongicarpus TaxID=13093 RepID=UPI00254F9076|nr:uncharacterized protein LOC130646215 isoform X2 [Hydractinia symbiolongicarpus]